VHDITRSDHLVPDRARTGKTPHRDNTTAFSFAGQYQHDFEACLFPVLFAI